VINGKSPKFAEKEYRMKLARPTLRAVSLVLFLAGTAGFLRAQTTVQLAPLSVTVAPGAVVDVAVSISGVSGLFASHITVAFDTTVLQYTGVTGGSFMPAGSFFEGLISATLLTVDQSVLDKPPAAGSGTLFTMHFTSLKVGSSSLTFQSVDLRDTLNQQLISTNTGGVVTVVPLLLAPKVFLQGPYNPATTLMRTSLKMGGALGTQFPTMVVPAYAVDSVNVEIRDSSSAAASTIRRFAPAWLLTDGTMRAFSDTTQNGVALDAPAGTYFVVIRHRNHLAVMSNAAMALTSASMTAYDFTTGQAQAWGTNALAALSGGVYGLYGGNGDGNSIITVADYNPVGGQMFQAGYRAGDHDLSGLITVADYNFVGANMFKSPQVP